MVANPCGLMSEWGPGLERTDMKRAILSLSSILLFSGCIAIVDKTPSERKVKAFVVPREEVVDILDQADQKGPEDTQELLRVEPHQEPAD